MENYDLSQKIIEYLDGELPVSEEPLLFSALAESEELRSEMRQQLAIRNSILVDKDAYSPPTDSFNNIGKILGLSIVTNYSTGNSLTKAGNVSKYLSPVFFTLLGVVLTLLFLKFGFKPEEIPQGQRNVSIVQTPPIIISTFEEEKNGSSSSYIIDKSKVKVQEPLDYENETNRFSNTNLLNESRQYYSVSTIENLSNQNAFRSKFQVNEETPRIGFDDNSVNEQRFSILIRGISGRSFPNPEVSTNDNLLYSNMATGVYLSRWSNVKFGIEFGREPFGQKFRNTEGIEFIVEQKPMIFWGAVGMDFSTNLTRLNSYLVNSYVTLLAGGTQIGGPLLKLLSGVRLEPAGLGVGMYFGLEGTMLFYRNESRIYNTNKLGVTYGLSINF